MWLCLGVHACVYVFVYIFMYLRVMGGSLNKCLFVEKVKAEFLCCVIVEVYEPASLTPGCCVTLSIDRCFTLLHFYTHIQRQTHAQPH